MAEHLLRDLPGEPRPVHRIDVRIEDHEVEVPDQDSQGRQPGLVVVNQRGHIEGPEGEELEGIGFEPEGEVKPAGMGIGLLAANRMVEREAERLRMPASRYREVLRLRWREALPALENAASSKEKKL